MDGFYQLFTKSQCRTLHLTQWDKPIIKDSFYTFGKNVSKYGYVTKSAWY